MIVDVIEWDDQTLDHATRRLTAEETVQAIWNSHEREIQAAKDAADRRLIRSTALRGK